MSIITDPSQIINAIRDGEPSDPQHFIDVVETAVDSQTRAATSEIAALNAAESARLTQEAADKIIEKGGTAVTTSGVLQLTFETNTKQDKLVSGQNIRTYNNESLLGTGNIEPFNPFKVLWKYTGTPPSLSTNYIIPVEISIGKQYIFEIQYSNTLLNCIFNLNSDVFLTPTIQKSTVSYNDGGTTVGQIIVYINLNTKVISSVSFSQSASTGTVTTTTITTSCKLLRIIEVVY